jgi:hypothetical protein
MILTLISRRTKALELMKIGLIIDLNTFDLNMFLILKLMDFENVALTKVVHIYMIKVMNA